jgi:hypothetical protein
MSQQLLSGGKRKRIPKLKPKRKGMRKRTSSLSSKYSIDMLVAPQLQSGGNIESLNSAMDNVNNSSDKFYNELNGKQSSYRKRRSSGVKRRSSGVKRRSSGVKRRSSGVKRRSSGVKFAKDENTGLKELALMGNHALSMGVHVPINAQYPFDSKYLIMNPELRQKVAMADPVTRNLLSEYGPGWTGYEIGLSTNKMADNTVKITSKSPQLGLAMSPQYHPAFASTVVGSRVSDWGVKYGLIPQGPHQNVKTIEGLERIPQQDRMNVTSDFSYYSAPDTLTVSAIGVNTDDMPSMKSDREKK